ncbi:pectinesterase family protein [Paenibacillus hexagrammi]|uniref:Pectinesterase family protein n=1 Tax=Paenibacillus hexagrammi TaxID=2908839 RepID=A0ABY3SCK8_9BACL|nr:pectinesterase family protein [Paenibacillus sp. YPD9-1]UJF31724.1 pectinesterase family protein [Paenibacillus sp. YPD9-1]
MVVASPFMGKGASIRRLFAIVLVSVLLFSLLPAYSSASAAAAVDIPGQIEAENWTAMNGVQAEASSDTGGGQDVAYIDAGDWLEYTINVPSTGTYQVDFRVSSKYTDRSFQLLDSNSSVLTNVYVPNTRAFQTWTTISLPVQLNAGTQNVRISTSTGGFNLNWLAFTSIDAATFPKAAPGIIEAEAWDGMSDVRTESTSDTGGGLNVSYIDTGDWLTYMVNVTNPGTYTVDYRVASPTGGEIQLQDQTSTVTSAVYVPNTTGYQNWTTISTTATLSAGIQSIRIYAKTGGFNLNWIKFTAIEAPPPTPTPTSSGTIPGQIDAVNWYEMNGVQTETTTDSGSGTVVDYIDDGDWMDYNVDVATTDFYSVDLRVASKSGGGKVQFMDQQGTVLSTVEIPATGNWSWWTTVNTTIHLEAGSQILRIAAVKGGFNFNWMNFTVKSFTPDGMYSIAGNTTATIGWSPVAKALSYNVKRSTAVDGPYQQLENVSANTFNDSNLQNNTTYYYQVSAVTSYGESSYSTPVAVTPLSVAAYVLQGTARDSQISLQWDAVDRAESYDVLRSDNGGDTYQSLATGVSATTYTDAGLTDGTNYQYVIQAKSSSGIIGNSNVIEMTPVVPIDRPDGLTANEGNSSVTLTWSAVPGAASYTVKRSTLSGRSYAVVADNVTDLTFKDETVTNDTTYYYVVSANSSSTTSMNSDQVAAYPFHLKDGAPSKPENVKVVPGSNRVALQWSEVAGAATYSIKRATTYEGPYETIASVSETSFTDMGLTNGTTYFYSVSAVNDQGEGNRSNVRSATPANVIIVAKDGTGDFTTVTDAINSISGSNTTRQVIFMKNGVYKEKLTINKPFVSLVGESRDGTILTYDDYAVVGTSNSFSVKVTASDFSAESLTFQNSSFPRSTAGPSVALFVVADRAYFNNVRIVGYQDTLYINSGRQYFKDSIIEGDVDWIFGNANAIFDHSEIKMVGNGGGYVTAASTDQLSPYGYTFLNSKLTRGTSFLKGQVANWDPAWDIDQNPAAIDSSTELGRPWRGYANVKYIHTDMDAHIAPDGWFNWGKPMN